MVLSSLKFYVLNKNCLVLFAGKWKTLEGAWDGSEESVHKNSRDLVDVIWGRRRIWHRIYIYITLFLHFTIITSSLEHLVTCFLLLKIHASLRFLRFLFLLFYIFHPLVVCSFFPLPIKSTTIPEALINHTPWRALALVSRPYLLWFPATSCCYLQTAIMLR